jgi:hypothetical protein
VSRAPRLKLKATMSWLTNFNTGRALRCYEIPDHIAYEILFRYLGARSARVALTFVRILYKLYNALTPRYLHDNYHYSEK